MPFRWELSLVVALTALLVWLALDRLPGWRVSEQEVAVQVARVRQSPIVEKIPISGVLMPVNEVQARSQLAGRVTELRVKNGDSVSAGTVIALIHASELAHRKAEIENAVQSARKELRAKEDQLAVAERFAEHRRELFKQDLIAQREVENAVAAVQSIGAETELARAHLSQQEVMLEQAAKIQTLSHVTAPAAGLVSRLWVARGAMVAETSPIVNIASGEWMKFVGRAAGADAAMMREGLSAVISVDEDIDGIVSRVISRPAQDGSSADVEIQIKTKVTNLRLGMAAKAVINANGSGPRLRVPRSAVFESAGSDYVYKISAGRAARQAVGVGAAQGDEVVIERGLEAGDLVIVDKVQTLKPSSRVRPAMQNEPS